MMQLGETLGIRPISLIPEELVRSLLQHTLRFWDTKQIEIREALCYALNK